MGCVICVTLAFPSHQKYCFSVIQITLSFCDGFLKNLKKALK